MNKDYRDWSDDKVQETLDIVEGHINNSLKGISKITKVHINDDIQNKMETFVIKTIMKRDLKYEQSYRMLKMGFDNMSLKNKISVWLIETKRWLRKILRLENKTNGKN